MMATCVRGHFKNVQGRLNFDPADAQHSSVEVEIDANGLWTGELDRDAHLRSADFLDVEHFKTVTFRSRELSLLGDHKVTYRADLIVERAVILELKAAAGIDPSHEAQLLNYLRATEIEVGLVLNFGSKPQFKRRCLRIPERQVAADYRGCTRIGQWLRANG